MRTDTERLEWLAANAAADMTGNNDASGGMEKMGEHFESAVENGAKPIDAMRAAIDTAMDRVPVGA